MARAHGAEPGRTGAQYGTTWGRPEPYQPEPTSSMDGFGAGNADRWAIGAQREGDPDILAVWEPTGHALAAGIAALLTAGLPAVPFGWVYTRPAGSCTSCLGTGGVPCLRFQTGREEFRGVLPHHPGREGLGTVTMRVRSHAGPPPIARREA